MTEVELTAENFHQEAECAAQPVLLDFYAPWCGPCQAQAQILDALEQESGGDWKLCKINIDESKTLTERFGVMSVPTLLVMQQGSVVARRTGVQGKAELQAMLGI